MLLNKEKALEFWARLGITASMNDEELARLKAGENMEGVFLDLLQRGQVEMDGGTYFPCVLANSDETIIPFDFFPSGTLALAGKNVAPLPCRENCQHRIWGRIGVSVTMSDEELSLLRSGENMETTFLGLLQKGQIEMGGETFFPESLSTEGTFIEDEFYPDGALALAGSSTQIQPAIRA